MLKIKSKITLIVLCSCVCIAGLIIIKNSMKESFLNRHVLVLNRIRSHMISDSVYLRVHKTKIYIDSLRANDTIKLKAILLARPGLLDHIQLLEHIYQLQNK